MSSHLDFWRPSKRQLETLADCVAARLNTARTVRLLGIDEPTFMAWTKRLAKGAVFEQRMVAEFMAAPSVPGDPKQWRAANVPLARLRPI